MPLCLRYVDHTLTIREKFVSFVRCDSGTDGSKISEAILEKLKELNIDMRLCRGQGYDGAGNMSGKYIGASTRIKLLFPLAIYIHCFCQCLNLCLSKSCEMQLVLNMIGTLEKAILFFENSQKRLN